MPTYMLDFMSDNDGRHSVKLLKSIQKQIFFYLEDLG